MVQLPDSLAYDQLYDLKKDPEAQKNLATKRRYADKLKEMKQFLTNELKRFDNRPYGEFIPGDNSDVAILDSRSTQPEFKFKLMKFLTRALGGR